MVRRTVSLASRVIVAQSGDTAVRRRFIVIRVWDASLRLGLVIRKELKDGIMIDEALIRRSKSTLARKARDSFSFSLILLQSSVLQL